MNNPNQRCTCRDTSVQYCPIENQYEPNCWDCWYQMQEGLISSSKRTITPSDDDLPF